MALTEAQRQQMLAQTNKMLEDLAKLQEAAATFAEAEKMGIPIDATTRSSDLARQIQQQKATQPTPTPTPQSTPTPTMTPTPKDVAKDVGLPKTKVNIGGIEFELPKELVNSSAFQSATDEQKAMIAYTWQSVADQGQDIQQLLQAFEVAAQQSDVYMRQQIRTFEDTLSMEFGYIIEDYGVGKEMILRQMDYTTADLEAYEKLMSRRARELEEDLERYGADLSIDQTKELKYQLQRYEQDLETTRENMASRGLFHSSIRGRAEQILAEAHADITEDIETKYARQRREAEISTQRGLADIEFQTEQKRIEAQRQQQQLQDQLAQLKTTTGRQATSLLRQGEQYLGTEHMQQLLPNMGISVGQQDWMPADWMVGDITATGLKQQQHQDILQRAQAFLGK